MYVMSISGEIDHVISNAYFFNNLRNDACHDDVMPWKSTPVIRSFVVFCYTEQTVE